MYFDQQPYDVRCEWGERGVAALAPASDVVIIVDVLSFCTCVDVAVSRGAAVYPFAGAEAAAFAAAVGALVAARDRAPEPSGFSLSPVSLLALPAGARLVLPSPNGATLTLAARAAAPSAPVLAGCLRNAAALAAAAGRLGRRVAVIPAGERWPGDGSLRPAAEDWVGAGAIIARLSGTRSPEAEAAVTAFERAQPALAGWLPRVGSGRELIARGFAGDVALAAALDASNAAPQLSSGGFFA